MKIAEALELLKDPEALRIRAAELDGWERDGATINGNQMYRRGKARVSLKVCPADINEGAWWMPHYAKDANSLFLAEHRLGLHDRSNTRLRVQWVNYLHDLLGAQPDCPVNKVGTPVVSDIDKLLAPVAVRCLAFVMAAEWKAKQDGKGVAA
jgi:hypothetical protein